MKMRVLWGALIASVLLAILNNLFTDSAVAWTGSPEILPKPEGWPSLGAMAGIAAGLKVAWKGFLAHKAVILGVIAVLAAALAYARKTGGRSTPILLTAFRLGLAAMFLAAAWPKFTDPADFALLVAQYQFLPSFLVNPFSLWLSAFEIVVALGLVLTPWEREFSVLVGLLMAMFIVALGQALARGLGIACGCFDIAGAADAGETWFSLVRDVVLLPVTAWMAAAGGRRWLWHLRERW